MPAFTPSLSKWIGDSNARRQLEQFGVEQGDLQLDYLRERADDYYLSLVNQLFEFLRAEGAVRWAEWARLGNALNQFAAPDNGEELQQFGIDHTEARLFAATAFYCGSYPASACLILRQAQAPAGEGLGRALFEVLSRPAEFSSRPALILLQALSRGDRRGIAVIQEQAAADEQAAFAAGPEQWVAAKLWLRVVEHFARSNLRAVLPDGFAGFWSPLVDSMIARQPAVYEFFPSQIDAIQAGLVSSDRSFSLQMPTGAGKTALCETLLFWQARQNPAAVSVLLVPFRSLAAELRRSIVPRLSRMGITASCAYGGTVPSQDEIQAIDQTQVLVATPETLAGLLTADETFFGRIALVICDEGHLIEAPGRGIGLELLLARFKARPSGAPRFVFISAIVPNIEEINAWLGGTAETVVRSDYRPAQAEYAMLHLAGRGRNAAIELSMHPEQPRPVKYSIPGFLTREDFQWTNEHTGRQNTYSFGSYKTQAVAAARKALTMGGVVIFAANKRGDQGAIGIGAELLDQLEVQTRLPVPGDYGDSGRRARVVTYLTAEYGPDWMGTKLINAGAVLHHGDIPQETREVFESLLREDHVRLAICTSTLAEGVNLPIRTLVLYSVQRSGPNGRPVPLNARDIKNLVGRAGRAGATTRGLVICANENQWELIAPVALQQPGENVRGALYLFLTRLQRAVALRAGFRLTNEMLEASPAFFPLIDGLDSALVDLMAEEMGEEQLLQTAQQVVDHTFAATKADEPRKQLLNVFVRSRATRITELRGQQRLSWIKETGARVRTLREVETVLLPMRPAWDNFATATDDELVTALLTWAWPQPEMRNAVMEAYRITLERVPAVQEQVFQIVRLWLNGDSYERIAQTSGLEVDVLLGVRTRVVSFTLQTIVEQGISLLKKLLGEQGRELAVAVEQFPDALRFGLPLPKAVALAAGGVRHRRAAYALGSSDALREAVTDNLQTILSLARVELRRDEDGWRERLGDLVFEHTRADLGG